LNRLNAARATNTSVEGEQMQTGKPVDHPDRQTVKVRQGTGPRATVSVLFISLILAAMAGMVLLAYFYFR
jgi:hypothetical protein